MVLRTAFKIFKKVKNYDDALRTALRLNSSELVTEAFAACEEPLEKKQLAYILAREVGENTAPYNL
jgi:26S proteasome regulatory subunit N1